MNSSDKSFFMIIIFPILFIITAVYVFNYLTKSPIEDCQKYCPNGMEKYENNNCYCRVK